MKKKHQTLVRIACGELESFYLGDLNALEQGLNITGISNKQGNKKFKNPDALNNASQELSKLTDQKYQKVSGSQSISKHLDIEKNTSKSFNVLVSGIRQLIKPI